MYGNVKPDHNHMSMGIRRRFSERLTLEVINGNCLYCKNFVLVGEHHVERNISNLDTFVEKYVKWGNTACTSISASIDIYLWECTM